MDVRKASTTAVAEHDGTVVAYFMFGKDELRDASMGSTIEFINEFTVEAGARIEPHFHNSHEFYYVLDGEGWMQVGDEKQYVTPRTLIYIPPNAPHSMWPAKEGEGMRCLCWANTFEEPGQHYHVTSLPDLG